MEDTELTESWFEQFAPMNIQYMATYDPMTGSVISVGPSYAFEDQTYKLDIDSETALLILEGKIQLTSCFVDLDATTMEISEVRAAVKIDDVLHRIISSEFTEVLPDVMLVYNGNLTVSLSSDYNGKRKVRWDGNTDMNFLITDYNDPNIVYNMFTIKVSDLVEKPQVITGLDIPAKFSVYTRRLFKNYVIEYK